MTYTGTPCNPPRWRQWGVESDALPFRYGQRHSALMDLAANVRVPGR